MSMFGPSQDEVWRQLAEEAGAEYFEGGFWKGDKVQTRTGPWTMTLDTFTVHTGQVHITCTRLRAPYVNPGGLRFSVYRKGILSGLGKLLGMQDIEIGDTDFDEAFIVKGTDEFQVRELFADPEIRSLLMAQPQIHLEVKDSEGWFGPAFPENVDELHFQVAGVIKDVDRLKGLFKLFAVVLDRLVRIGSACKEVPGVEL